VSLPENEICGHNTTIAVLGQDRRVTMATCTFEGNSDMYGLGIRLGFYITWLSGILAGWLAPGEVKGIAFTLDVFVFATFLALVIQVALDSLKVVEVYIVLLLTFGNYIALVFYWIWRIVTRFDPYLDPSRSPRARTSRTTSDLRTLLLLAVVAFQLWFWLGLVPSTVSGLGCREYGFLFTKVDLGNTALRVTNIVLNFILGTILIYCIVLRFGELGRASTTPTGTVQTRQSKRDEEQRVLLLQRIDTVFRIVLVTIIVVATELTIRWNDIQDVYTLTSAGQTIPFIIGVAALVRVIYLRLRPSKRKHSGRRPTHQKPLEPSRMPEMMAIHQEPLETDRMPEMYLETSRMPELRNYVRPGGRRASQTAYDREQSHSNLRGNSRDNFRHSRGPMP